MEYVKHFIREDDGQDAVEYGLLIAGIGLVLLIGTGTFGTQLTGAFTDLATRVHDAFTGTPYVPPA